MLKGKFTQKCIGLCTHQTVLLLAEHKVRFDPHVSDCFQDTTVRLWNIRDTDKIPLVQENRKTHGLKMRKVGPRFLYLWSGTKYVTNLCRL